MTGICDLRFSTYDGIIASGVTHKPQIEIRESFCRTSWK